MQHLRLGAAVAQKHERELAQLLERRHRVRRFITKHHKEPLDDELDRLRHDHVARKCKFHADVELRRVDVEEQNAALGLGAIRGLLG
jgi:hypothetical protein